MIDIYLFLTKYRFKKFHGKSLLENESDNMKLS